MTYTHQRGYLIAALLGAVGGGLIVSIATKAIPKMLTGIMAGMLENMQAQGCNPQEM